jgi:predicted transposase/invertase (TIGR01784 family)
MRWRVMTKKLLSLKNDYVFKKIFGSVDNVDVLADFLHSVLNLPKDEFKGLEITDPNSKRTHGKDKDSVLDIKVFTKSRKVIDVEIQLKFHRDFLERIVYYTSKAVTEQMTSGAEYHIIKKVISVIITDFDLMPGSPYYQNVYGLYDKRSDTAFGDIMEINLLELSKLPPGSDGSRLWDWLTLMKTEEEDVMVELAKENVKIGKVVGTLRKMSEDEIERELATAREKMRFDHMAGLHYAREEGIEEGKALGEKVGESQAHLEDARRMKSDGMDLALIGKYTGLSKREIEKL